jgi:hypothetical protein
MYLQQILGSGMSWMPRENPSHPQLFRIVFLNAALASKMLKKVIKITVTGWNCRVMQIAPATLMSF